MKVIQSLAFLTLFLGSAGTTSTIKPIFKSEIYSSNFCAETVKITCFEQEKKIGCIYCVQLPFSYYVLHSLYMYPEYRNKGYGKSLLAYACKNILQKKPRRIFIQPGPFNFVDGTCYPITEPTERAKKIEQLRVLYGNAGFKKVGNFLSRCASLLYLIARIPEDASDLMAL